MTKTPKTPKQTLKSITPSAERVAIDELFGAETDPREDHADTSVRMILALALVHDAMPERDVERIAWPRPRRT